MGEEKTIETKEWKLSELCLAVLRDMQELLHRVYTGLTWWNFSRKSECVIFNFSE